MMTSGGRQVRRTSHLKEEDEDDTGSDGETDHPPPAPSGNQQHSQYDDEHGAHHPEDLIHTDREHAGRAQLMTSQHPSDIYH